MGIETAVLAAGVGVAAGVVSGLIGVGGGALFVPALVLLLGLGQLEAEATSLLAIVPVAAVDGKRGEVLVDMDEHPGRMPHLKRWPRCGRCSASRTLTRRSRQATPAARMTARPCAS